jgi:hypothetical protein
MKEPVRSHLEGAEVRANLVRVRALLIELESAVAAGDEARANELRALVEEALRASRPPPPNPEQ